MSALISGQEIPEGYDTIQGLAQLLDDVHHAHQTSELGEATQFMIAMLDMALHGHTTAQPQSPRAYWLQLLGEVERLAGGRR